MNERRDFKDLMQNVQTNLTPEQKREDLRAQIQTAQRRLDTGKNVDERERAALIDLIANAKARLEQE